jgi:hypothetical protein
MYRFLLAAAPLLLVAVQPPAFAAGSNDTRMGAKCQKKKKSGGMFGTIAGNVAGMGLGRVGLPSMVTSIGLPVTSLLSDAIISRLNCKEQVQAANATTEATRGGVGTTSTWQSDTRPGVTGSSTVVAQNSNASGGSCMTVTDVVIVDGEETTVDKRMCRAEGGGNYVVAV